MDDNHPPIRLRGRLLLALGCGAGLLLALFLRAPLAHAHSAAAPIAQNTPAADPGLLPTPTPQPPATPAVAAPPVRDRRANALLLAEPGTSLASLLAVVEQAEGAALHILPPNAMLAALPPAADERLQAAGARVERGPVDAASFGTYGASARLVAQVWNRAFPPLAVAAAEPFQPPEGSALVGDAFAAPPPADLGALSADAAVRPAEGSVYLARRIAVNIVLPESSGDGENWSTCDPADPGQDRSERVVLEIIEGLDWWIAQESRAELSFVYTVDRVPVPVEPIDLPQGRQSDWIGPALTALGFPDESGYFDQVRSLNHLRRTQQGADWAFTIFVVDSLNDDDGMLADSHFAYAYLGGPFLVMTYDVDSWGIENMDRVFAHELVHIFQGYDEYLANLSCQAPHGYLDVPNRNTVLPLEGDACGAPVPCLMRSGDTADGLCAWTRGQIGWLDSDADSILDPLDTTTALDLEPWPTEATNTSRPTYRGRAWEVPFPSPRQRPVSINAVTQVAYSLDGGAWEAAVPVDGAFDSAGEEFSLTLPPLADGPHSLFIWAGNTVGNGPDDLLYDTFLVDTAPPWASLRVGLAAPGESPTQLTVDLQGGDGLSGLQSWDLEVADSGAGPWRALAEARAGGRVLFDAEAGRSYAFRARARDWAGNVSPWSAPLVWEGGADVTPPVLSLEGARRSLWSASRDVLILIDAHDEGSGIDAVRLREGGGAWTTWEAVESTRAWRLSEGEGLKRVEVEVRDRAGNCARAVQEIGLDLTPPQSALAPLAAVCGGDVLLEWSAADGASGVSHHDLQVRRNDGPWQPLLEGSTDTRFRFAGEPGATYAFRVRAVDRAGLVEAWAESGPQVQGTRLAAAAPLQSYLPFVSR